LGKKVWDPKNPFFIGIEVKNNFKGFFPFGKGGIGRRQKGVGYYIFHGLLEGLQGVGKLKASLFRRIF